MHDHAFGQNLLSTHWTKRQQRELSTLSKSWGLLTGSSEECAGGESGIKCFQEISTAVFLILYKAFQNKIVQIKTAKIDLRSDFMTCYHQFELQNLPVGRGFAVKPSLNDNSHTHYRILKCSTNTSIGI